MKKIMLVTMAVILAIGFSAFTPHSKLVTTFYQDDSGTWHSFTGTPCPSGSNPDCIVTIGGKQRQLFNSESTLDPYLRN